MAKNHYAFLKNFNNYFNRKLIKLSTLVDYIDAAGDYFVPVITGQGAIEYDFNPNDNVTTEIIVNDMPFDPDYFLLLDLNNEIESRWFVIEQKRNRQGQWIYTLRRDVLADKLDDIKNLPLYVEKGIIKDPESPLLLNNEDLRVNQIKTKEVLLKDRTDSAWLVMYLKKGVLGTPQYNNITINVPNADFNVYETLSTPITSWKFWDYQNTDMVVAKINKTLIYVNLPNSDPKKGFYEYILRANESMCLPITAALTNSNRTYSGTESSLFTALRTALLDSTFIASFKTAVDNDFSYSKMSDLEELLNYQGKIIKDSLGRYYEVTRVYQVTADAIHQAFLTNFQPQTKNLLDTLWTGITGQTAPSNDNSYKLRTTYANYRVEIVERTDIETAVDLSTYTGNGTTDSMLFDVICMPYGNVTIKNDSIGSVFNITASAERSLIVMSAIARELTSQNVLDLQLLPYLPAVYLNTPSRGTVLTGSDYDDTAVFGKYGGAPKDVIIVSSVSNFTLDLPYQIYIENDITSKVNKIKYLNDCTMVRLCSPNYNGVFEMNLAKNGDTLGYGGDINGFNADITLRPHNPYIHVTPNFAFLYGQDFDDYRGLICGGDFSLGIIDDAWQNYEIQNKNYQAIFDRQIQNMEVNNSITRQEATFGAISGVVQGGAAGAAAGGMAAGPWGAVAGAVVGAGASAVGGALDLANLEKRQKEAISYAVDNYNLQLGNIKALPYSITRTNAITYNNKLFPFIEIYECTEVEKKAYLDKIYFNGMTVGIIDTIRNYLSGSPEGDNFFRGKLIRAYFIAEDYHFAAAINEELMKGVMI